MADALARTEAELRTVVESDEPFLTEVARHLIDAGGKRVRPAMTVTAAQVLNSEPGPATADVIRGGVAVELVRQGSLSHDDVMDAAETRRTVQSVNARWGNLEAILAGDYLLARASESAADLGPEVAGLLASTIASLCEGQVRELRHAFDVNRSEEAYLTSITGKTASLLATAARIGAIVADHPRAVVDSVTNFGHYYGMAFQVVDDILDLIATDEELGKPSGNDLREGVYTLPVIRMIADGHPVTDLLGQQLDEETRDKARAIVVEGPEIATSVATAQEFVDTALAALDGLPATPGVQGMRDATTSLLSTLER